MITLPVEKARAHVFVSGIVQGVFFRRTCQKEAKKMGITGWVNNLKDGRVEAIFEGEKDKLEKMIKWAKGGPILAAVDGLEINWEDYQGEFNKFEIR